MKVYVRNSSSPFSIVDSSVAVLNSSGTGLFNFTNNVLNQTQYYLQINHRNSIETWSNLMSFTNYEAGYNFTAGSSSAFGSNQKSIDTSPIRFGFYSGDVNQGGVIDLSDVIQINSAANIFATGYVVRI